MQENNVSLMAEAVSQCGLYRDVLKTSSDLNWRHIIGPQSQDTGLWSSSNGWAAYGMTRVLHTLQRWSSSSDVLVGQAGQLKGWIQEILDGAMLVETDNGLLRNYLNDATWFGETSGTALLSAAAYRMAVNNPGIRISSQYASFLPMIIHTNIKKISLDKNILSGLTTTVISFQKTKEVIAYLRLLLIYIDGWIAHLIPLARLKVRLLQFIFI